LFVNVSSYTAGVGQGLVAGVAVAVAVAVADGVGVQQVGVGVGSQIGPIGMPLESIQAVHCSTTLAAGLLPTMTDTPGFTHAFGQLTNQ
jgi:hypothetical protein